jgi:hypothetical protein
MPGKSLFEFHASNRSFITDLLSTKPGSQFLFGEFIPHADSSARFWNLSTKQISKAKKAKKFFVLDSMHEGFSEIYDRPKLEEIYHCCELYSINPKQIILVTMNLVAKQNVEKYSESYKLPKIQVLNLPFGQYELFRLHGQPKKNDVDHNLEITKKQFNKQCKEKILLNLNYRYRQPRSSLAFYLATSKIKDYCVVTHNEKYKKTPHDYWITLPDRTYEQEKRWSKTTPIIIDGKTKTNFKLHQSTVFEVVNETLTNSWDGTSREYSEKTFRPMLNFQPFVIYGQKGCNHYLKNLGYETYEDWFDLSFDLVEDEIERLLKLYRTIEQVTIKLSKMSTQDKANWRFKNEKVLKHNYQIFFQNNHMLKQETNNFFKNLQ